MRNNININYIKGKVVYIKDMKQVNGEINLNLGADHLEYDYYIIIRLNYILTILLCTEYSTQYFRKDPSVRLTIYAKPILIRDPVVTWCSELSQNLITISNYIYIFLKIIIQVFTVF